MTSSLKSYELPWWSLASVDTICWSSLGIHPVHLWLVRWSSLSSYLTQGHSVWVTSLEEFSKPLSLSFRLLGNILADELTLAVLYSLVPFCIPVPVFLLGLFTCGIQALVFATLAGAYIGESLEACLD